MRAVRALEDPAEWQARSAAAREQARTFDWDRSAAELFEVLLRVAKKPRRPRRRWGVSDLATTRTTSAPASSAEHAGSMPNTALALPAAAQTIGSSSSASSSTVRSGVWWPIGGTAPML